MGRAGEAGPILGKVCVGEQALRGSAEAEGEVVGGVAFWVMTCIRWGQ